MIIFSPARPHFTTLANNKQTRQVGISVGWKSLDYCTKCCKSKITFNAHSITEEVDFMQSISVHLCIISCIGHLSLSLSPTPTDSL